MESTAIYTVIKMMETLPEPTQNRVVDLVREFLADFEDEAEWEAQFAATEPQLLAAASLARQEMQEGKAELMDLDRL